MPFFLTTRRRTFGARVPLWLEDACRTACGRGLDNYTVLTASVTCRHCLKQMEMRGRPPEPSPEIPSQPAPERAPHWESFYSKVAGVVHANGDGSSRQEIIKYCRVGEKLTLVREPTNPFD